jgi:hypothetical protein
MRSCFSQLASDSAAMRLPCAASLSGCFYTRRVAATKSRYEVACKADAPRRTLSLSLTIGCLKAVRKPDAMFSVLATALLLFAIEYLLCRIRMNLFQHFQDFCRPILIHLFPVEDEVVQSREAAS